MKTLVIDRERVEILMKREGIQTFRELSEKSGLHKNTLTKVLSGQTWDSRTVEKLAGALNCSPIDLQTAQGYPAPNLVTLAAPCV
jgi:lambda repressor-like predicted transcriptional regulator